jgi:hypothetical protein
MYGKTTDARAIAMVAIEAEAWRKQQLADLEAKKEPITERMLTQLDAEKRARILVGEATLGQTKALQYASQLAEENKRFGLDYIADDRERASAQLAIDSQLWQERIALAGDGTEAQKLLQQEYVVWYRNQSIKPQLDEQKKMWASIEQTAHDTFISIFDSSKNAWARMRDSAKNIFFDWLYQMTMKKWIVNIGASVGFDGSTAMAQAMAGGPDATAGSIGAGNSTITAAQAASNVYTMFKSGGTMEQSIASGVQTGFDKLGLSMGSGAPGQAAQWAGQIGGTVGGYMIGSTLNSAISGKYETGSGFMTAEKIGTAVASAIFGPIGGAVAGAISGLVNRAFGMGPKEVTDQGLKGTLSASSLSGQSYTSYHQDGGWFRSDKNGTDTKALTDAMIKQFTQGLAAIENASSGFAMSLGVQADWIKDYSKEFDLKLTGEQAKDQQAITDFFTGIGDEIAGKLVPNLNDFAKSGEALSATLQRLAGDFQGTDKVAQLLGFSADTLFGAAGLGGAKAREQLIDMAGGLSALSSQAAFFNQNFLADAERIKPVAEALDKALASLGLSTIPATRDEFKSLVNSLITSGAAASESGAKQLDSLLALAEAFAQVHPAADAAAEAVDKAAEAMQAVKDAAATMFAGVNDSYSALQKVVGREKSAIQVSVDAHTAAFGKLQSLSQALHSTLDSLKSPDQKAMERAVGQAQIRAALAIAKAGGPLPDSEKLKQALSAVTQDASSQFGSYADYMRDLLQTQNDVAQLAGLTDDSLSVEQRSLDALKDQLARLDDIVANGQLQLDALNGQSIATLSLGQALAAFQSSISTAQTNPVVGGTATIAGFYQDLLGRAPDAAGFDYWKGILAGGTSLDKIRSFFMESDEYKGLHKIPGFASGGDFAGGIRAVGERGIEIEATGASRIHSTQAIISALRNPSNANEALVTEVRALREEVKQLREANSAENRAIAKGTQETAGHLDAAVNGETPLATKVLA